MISQAQSNPKLSKSKESSWAQLNPNSKSNSEKASIYDKSLINYLTFKLLNYRNSIISF